MSQKTSKTSKRAVAKEWKRKRKQQQRLTKLMIAAFCAIAVLGIGYVAWDLWSRTYVMTFEGRRVNTDDMRFFAAVSPLFGGDPFDQLTRFLLIDQAASQHNIILSEEERAQVAENLGFFEMIGIELPSMSNERMIDLAGADILTDHLIDIYTADFVVDESDFDESFSWYLEFQRGQHVEMDLRYHLSNSTVSARVAQDDLYTYGPEGYDDILMRDMGEIRTTTLAELRQNQLVSFSDINDIASLELHEISGIVPMGDDGYAVFIPDSIDALTDDEIKVIFREQYEHQQRIMIFTEVLETWFEAADIQINERGIGAVLRSI